jgi:hypothetical protein
MLDLDLRASLCDPGRMEEGVSGSWQRDTGGGKTRAGRVPGLPSIFLHPEYSPLPVPSVEIHHLGLVPPWPGSGGHTQLSEPALE